MKNFLINVTKSLGLTFIGFIILGVLLAFFPTQTKIVAGYVSGGIILAFGIIKIVAYFKKENGQVVGTFGLAVGIVSAIAGLFLISEPEIIIESFVWIFGIIILVDGIIKLQRAIDLKRIEMKKWWGVLTVAVISIAFGVIILNFPKSTSIIMIRILGVAFVFAGASDLWTLFRVKKEFKPLLKKGGNEIDGEATVVDSEDE